jgi:hypothetical protein
MSFVALDTVFLYSIVQPCDIDKALVDAQQAALGRTACGLPSVKKIKTELAPLRQLRVAKTYAPGQDGAKRFARRYGDRLVCVRHRLSEDATMRHTTVELLVESTPVASRARTAIAVRIPHADKRMRALLLACGARWQPENRYWLVPHLVARNLRILRHRVPLRA